MSHPWPPPLDLASVQELVRAADVEGFLAEGAPADEYGIEEEQWLAAIEHLPVAQVVTANILPSLERIWQKSFSLNEEALAQRRPRLLAIAKEVERFFGPESRPRTRAQILADNGPA